MGHMIAHTVNIYESARIQSWYPCLTDTIINLDVALLRRLEDSPYIVELSYADVTCALRWFNSVPVGFLTQDDKDLADRLSGSLCEII